MNMFIPYDLIARFCILPFADRAEIVMISVVVLMAIGTIAIGVWAFTGPQDKRDRPVCEADLGW